MSGSKKVSDLLNLDTSADGDLVVVVDISETDITKKTKKQTKANLLKEINAKADGHIADTDNPHDVTKTQVGLGNVDNTADADKPISEATQGALDNKADETDLTTHTGNTSNPHGVTKAQVGLGNADNTSDANKPVSSATQTALDAKASASDVSSHIGNKTNPHEVTKTQIGLPNVTNDAQVKRSEMGQASGVATLGTDGKVPNAQIPALAIGETFIVASEVAMLALDAQKGDVAIRSDESKTYILSTDVPTVLANWKQILVPASPVQSVAGKTGIVILAKEDVGLGNVDNTTDATKPVSTPQQTALNLKADASALSSHTGNTSNPHSVTKAQVGLGNVDNTADASKPVSTAQQTALDLKSNKADIQKTSPTAPSELKLEVLPTEIVGGSLVTNLFNPAIALDGQVLDYSNGIPGAYAPALCTPVRAVPVQAGKTYTISLPSTETVAGGPGAIMYCWNEALAYLGTHNGAGGSATAPGITLGAKTNSNGRYQRIITITADSTVRYISFQLSENYMPGHTTTDFDRIRNSLQFEEGSAFTQYVAYGSPLWVSTGKVKDTAMPASFATAQADIVTAKSDITALKNKAGSLLKVIRSGQYVYFRKTWNATYDYVCYFGMNNITEVPYNNNCVNLIGEILIPVATLDANVPSTSPSVTIRSSEDDACPQNFNGTYIGANHGISVVPSVTVTGHDKTVQDIGSEWLDTNGKKWYIVRIVDANTLWLISENQATNPTWSFLTAVGGNLLTHSLGATHTGNITITATAVTQLTPAYNHQVKKILLDGLTEVIADGVYTCNFCDILHNYDIENVPDIIAYLKTQVGSATAPALNHTSIPSCARVTITYRITENCAISIFQTLKPTQNISLGYSGFIQSEAMLVPSGGTIFDYIPKTTSHVVATRTYDFKAIQDITTYADTHNIISSMWEDINNPPERFLQFVKDSGAVKKYGHYIGFNQVVGMGNPAIRKNTVNGTGYAFFFYSSKKMYPAGICGGSTNYNPTVLAGEVVDIVSFKLPVNYEENPSLTAFGWYQVGDDIYVNIDAHTNITKAYLALPQRFLGMRIEVIEKSADFTLHSNYVGQDGINYSIANNYGTAVLRLYK